MPTHTINPRPAARTAWCGGCLEYHPIDSHWFALWVDSDGTLLTSKPLNRCHLDYERPGTVFACGQGSALRVTERFFATGSLDSTLNLHPTHTACEHHA